MKKLEEIPATLAAIIKTCDLFKGQSVQPYVLIDDGTINAKMEDALNSVGWCVVVSPLLISTKTQTTAVFTSPDNIGLALFNAVCTIVIRTNPKSNKGATAVNPYIAISQITKAVLSWKPVHGERGFELVADATADPDFEDVGNFSYYLRVLKPVAIN